MKWITSAANSYDFLIVQVWEVSAQLLGLGGSVLLLKAIESSGAPTSVLWVWALIQVTRQWRSTFANKSGMIAQEGFQSV